MCEAKRGKIKGKIDPLSNGVKSAGRRGTSVTILLLLIARLLLALTVPL